MQSAYPAQAPINSPEQLNSAPQQAAAAPRGRARRQYAAQQYDFNAPAAPAPAPYGQQYDAQQYSAQGYAAGPAAMAPVQPGQPQGYPQPGPQYGQEYQQPSFDQRPAGVASMTSQFQNMQVSQVDLFVTCCSILACVCESVDISGFDEYSPRCGKSLCASASSTSASWSTSPWLSVLMIGISDRL